MKFPMNIELGKRIALIPRAILLLRKLARVHKKAGPSPSFLPQGKVGRNDPCPCGSGKKHKRCRGTRT